MRSSIPDRSHAAAVYVVSGTHIHTGANRHAQAILDPFAHSNPAAHHHAHHHAIPRTISDRHAHAAPHRHTVAPPAIPLARTANTRTDA